LLQRVAKEHRRERRRRAARTAVSAVLIGALFGGGLWLFLDKNIRFAVWESLLGKGIPQRD
jgi:hypothetical protein